MLLALLNNMSNRSTPRALPADGDGMECVAERLGVPWPLAAEIVNENDGFRETPAARWQRMRKWVERHITQETGK